MKDEHIALIITECEEIFHNFKEEFEILLKKLLNETKYL